MSKIVEALNFAIWKKVFSNFYRVADSVEEDDILPPPLYDFTTALKSLIFSTSMEKVKSNR